MFRRNNPVTGLQSNDTTNTNELPLRPAQASAPAAPAAPATATVQPIMTRPVGTPAAAAPKAELPASRFGGIPGVMTRRVGAGAEAQAPAAGDNGALRKLIVGREISLSGNITACDILVVEGHIEATLRDGRHLEITEAGHFKGSAEVDEADIAGKFEGTLTVRGRLKVRSTGQIEGTVSYGEIEVEAGGRLTGEMKVLASSATKSSSEEAAPARATA